MKPLSRQARLHLRRCGVGWILSWRVEARLGAVRRGLLGLGAFRVVQGSAMQARFRQGVKNHTRAGTVPDRRGRCGVNYGSAGRGGLERVWMEQVTALFGTKLV